MKRSHEPGSKSDRPTEMYLSPQKKEKYKGILTNVTQLFNPNDWGKSPLTDNALRLQQLQAENTEESPPVTELEFDEPIGVWRNGEYIPLQDLVVNLPEEE